LRKVSVQSKRSESIIMAFSKLELRCRTAAMTLLFLFGICSAAFSQGKPEKERIRIGYAARAVIHSIPYLTNEAGFFREEGLQVEVVRTAGSVAPMALISGDVDFTIMSSFLMTRYASMFFVSRPETAGAKELRGKIVGLQRPGDAYEKSARFAVRHLGLDPDKDVKFLFLGSNEVMWTALQTGKVAATMITPPATVFARKAGMNFLVNLSDLKIEYQGATLATRRSLIRDNPNLTRRVLRAVVRGIHFFKTRREETYRILAKFLGTNDRDALEDSWNYAADMPAKPYAVETAVQAVLSHLAEREPRYAQHRAAEFIDPGPLSEIDRSGFIDRLYSGQK